MYPERVPDKLILTEDALASPPKSRTTQANVSVVAVHRTALLRAMTLNVWTSSTARGVFSVASIVSAPILRVQTSCMPRLAPASDPAVRRRQVSCGWIWVGLYAALAIVIGRKPSQDQ